MSYRFVVALIIVQIIALASVSRRTEANEVADAYAKAQGLIRDAHAQSKFHTLYMNCVATKFDDVRALLAKTVSSSPDVPVAGIFCTEVFKFAAKHYSKDYLYDNLVQTVGLKISSDDFYKMMFVAASDGRRSVKILTAKGYLEYPITKRVAYAIFYREQTVNKLTSDPDKAPEFASQLIVSDMCFNDHKKTDLAYCGRLGLAQALADQIGYKKK